MLPLSWLLFQGLESVERLNESSLSSFFSYFLYERCVFQLEIPGVSEAHSLFGICLWGGTDNQADLLLLRFLNNPEYLSLNRCKYLCRLSI